MLFHLLKTCVYLLLRPLEGCNLDSLRGECDFRGDEKEWQKMMSNGTPYKLDTKALQPNSYECTADA